MPVHSILAAVPGSPSFTGWVLLVAALSVAVGFGAARRLDDGSWSERLRVEVPIAIGALTALYAVIDFPAMLVERRIAFQLEGSVLGAGTMLIALGVLRLGTRRRSRDRFPA